MAVVGRRALSRTLNVMSGGDVLMNWAWEWFTYERAFRLIDTRVVAETRSANAAARDDERDAG